jgi:hypothetical protein
MPSVAERPRYQSSTSRLNYRICTKVNHLIACDRLTLRSGGFLPIPTPTFSRPSSQVYKHVLEKNKIKPKVSYSLLRLENNLINFLYKFITFLSVNTEKLKDLESFAIQVRDIT